MFLVKLSENLLRLCGGHLSYEDAAELCQCSSKHFANIVNKRSQPSLNVFENICNGFAMTPNALLGVSALELERVPMPVTNVRMLGIFPFPVCPQCNSTLEREYQKYCDHCGQCLDWKLFHTAAVL